MTLMLSPGNATRLCQSNLIWAEPNVTNCQSRVFVDIMERVRENAPYELMADIICAG